MSEKRAVTGSNGPMTERVLEYLRTHAPPTPCLVVDLEEIRARYRRMRSGLPAARIYYAVKANPAPPVIDTLREEGASFDAASINEIELCLSRGVTPDNLSFGNTIKKTADIAAAHHRGVRLFAFDSAAELDKIARAAPGARVFCRLLIANTGAQWPLSKKFGCDIDMAADLLGGARAMGLEPYGASFHVGSQQMDLDQWDIAIGAAKLLFTTLAERGVQLSMLNLGGGFPVGYRAPAPAEETVAETIEASLARHFGNRIPDLIAEPGRSLVAEAGVLQAEVVLISRKSYADETRWVYLDAGRFNGLAETEDEAIKYAVHMVRDDGPGAHDGASSPVVLAGPTCDSVDIIYERDRISLPDDLRIGDKVLFMATGAYTASYASVGFNGFAPIETVCI